MFYMKSLFWNYCCARGKTFSNLMHDLIMIYGLQLVALVEPRISGAYSNLVVNKVGVDGAFHVNAHGFSKGIWYL